MSFSSAEVVIGPVSGTRRLLLSAHSQQQRVKALAAPSLRAGAALRFPTSGEGASHDSHPLLQSESFNRSLFGGLLWLCCFRYSSADVCPY